MNADHFHTFETRLICVLKKLQCSPMMKRDDAHEAIVKEVAEELEGTYNDINKRLRTLHYTMMQRLHARSKDQSTDSNSSSASPNSTASAASK